MKKFSNKKKLRYSKLNFVPYIDFNLLDNKRIKKYKLKNYLIVPNQFWKHKNHLILVKAINRLKNKNLKFKIVLTGDSNSQKDKNILMNLLKKLK